MAGCRGDLSSLSQYSDLELAINSLVTEFHKAADNGASMNTTQFQTMMSKQLPVVAKVPEAPPPKHRSPSPTVAPPSLMETTNSDVSHFDVQFPSLFLFSLFWVFGSLREQNLRTSEPQNPRTITNQNTLT